MSQFWVTGAVEAWVAPAGTPIFLGYCEKMPRPRTRRHYSPVMCDLYGQSNQADATYDGQEAFVSLDLTRYNESTYAILAHAASPLNASLGNIGRGTDDAGDYGTLMVQEAAAQVLWLRFPYASKVAMTGMPAGYRYAAAYLEDDDLDGLGTASRRTRLNFHCLRLFQGSSNNPLGPGKFILYDHDMTLLPASAN